jgi:C4-dicarboxylate-specific signal transduction histidine kinase
MLQIEDRVAVPTARRPWRLRTRLALALLAVFIPISAVLVASHLENLNERRDSRIESLQTISETVAAIVDGFANDLDSYTLSTSTTFALVPGSSLYNNAGLDPYLKSLADNYGNLRTIFLTDENGVVIAASTSQGAGTNLSARPYMVALRSGQDKVWTGAFSGLESGQSILTFGRTIRTVDGATFYMIVAFTPACSSIACPLTCPRMRA